MYILQRQAVSKSSSLRSSLVSVSTSSGFEKLRFGFLLLADDLKLVTLVLLV